jgi:hypothetical protein
MVGLKIKFLPLAFFVGAICYAVVREKNNKDEREKNNNSGKN